MNHSHFILIYTSTSVSRINYIIENSFENYRRDLTTFMKVISKMVFEMDALDRRVKGLTQLHAMFKNDVLAQIPVLWEENEQALRTLIDRSNINFTFGLTMQPR